MILQISFRSGGRIVFHRLHERHRDWAQSMCRCYTEALFLPACRCVAKWLQDSSACSAQLAETCSLLMNPALIPAACIYWKAVILPNTLFVDHLRNSRVSGSRTVPERNLVLDATWALESQGVCVYMCRRRFTHLLHYRRTQGRSEASSGMSSILFHKRLLIYGHLPSFCSVALRPLPEQHPPPPHTLPPNLLPTPHHHTHTYTLLLMLVSHGQRRECLFLCAGSDVVNTHLITGSDGSRWLCSFVCLFFFFVGVVAASSGWN